MSSPEISVLLPCRDAEPWLVECIESLELQTHEDFEVLAVDDGSRDGTGELLDEWARRDRRVRLSATKGVGIVAALNAAADDAGGSLLARMDADDVAHPERLAQQRRLMLERSELAGCGTGIRYRPREGLGSGTLRYEEWVNALSEPAELRRDLLVECPIAHPTLMLRATVFQALGGYRDAGWAEDYDLLLRAHALGFRLANVPRVLLDWRVTADRLSATHAAYTADAFQRCRAHHLDRSFLRSDRPFAVWGAGKVGKRLARALIAVCRRPCAFIDLDPRKIGQEIHGAPVLGPDDLDRKPRPYVIIAVGSPGARDEIRESLTSLGYVEIHDFRAAA